MDRRFMIIMLVLIVGFFGVIVFSKNESSGPVSSTGSSNLYGKLDSPVQLTEFVDYQCEACYAYYPIVKEVKEQYKDKVKFQVRNFPITSGHQFAYQAARSAEAAAKQGKFWEMHDQIFAGQKQWEKASDPQMFFDEYAKSIGLDMTQFKTDRESAEVAAIINKDLEDIKKLDGTGTPTFVLNGKKIETPGKTAAEFGKFLDEELKKAGVN